jgi:hypothetical protein
MYRTGYFPPHRPLPKSPLEGTGSHDREQEAIRSTTSQNPFQADSPPPARPVPASPRERDVTRERLRDAASGARERSVGVGIGGNPLERNQRDRVGGFGGPERGDTPQTADQQGKKIGSIRCC